MPREQEMTSLLWLCLAAYGIHVLEEFVFNWRSWARNVLNLPARWEDFYIANALVVVLGVVAAMIVPRWPVLSVGFPALMLINAMFFHVAPFLWTRGRFSPGLITAVILFFPLGIMTIRKAELAPPQIASAFAVGLLIMATPIVFLKLAARPYFDQDNKESLPGIGVPTG
jgi:hypothetical protein